MVLLNYVTLVLIPTDHITGQILKKAHSSHIGCKQPDSCYHLKEILATTTPCRDQSSDTGCKQHDWCYHLKEILATTTPFEINLVTLVVNNQLCFHFKEIISSFRDQL